MTLGVLKWAEGSCRIRAGDTEVLCAATIGDRVPPHLRGKGTGWVTAEYAMLPRATAERSDRESVKGKIGGRTHEIQRLIGRSLRGVVDLAQARRAHDHRRLRRPPGRRRHALRLDHRRLRGARRRAHGRRDGAVPRRQGRRRVGRDRPRRADARPRLLGGLARRGRHERRGHGLGHVHRAPGHRRGPAVRPGPGGLAARPRGHRPRPPVRGPDHRARFGALRRSSARRLRRRDPIAAQAARASVPAPARRHGARLAR